MKGDKLKVLDLFAGTGSSSQAFEDRGHEVVYVELDENLAYLLQEKYPKAQVLWMDVRRFAANPSEYLRNWAGLPSYWRPDVILGGPPCTAYSVAGPSNRALGNESRRWIHLEEWEYHPIFGPRFPKDRVAREGIACVLAFKEIVRKLMPSYWWMENPMGGLKTMGIVQDLDEPVIITYCQYGDFRMKPTTLWGKWPDTWVPRPRCYNGDTCHQSAPRGAKTGTQSLAEVDRSRWPYQLSEEICLSVEKVLCFPCARDSLDSIGSQRV